VADLNKAFTNSKINVTVKLVHAAKLNYDASGSVDSGLAHIKGNKTVNSLRDSKKADLITFFIGGTPKGNGGGGIKAGVGHVMPSAKGAVGACLTVVHEKYALSHHVLAHNLGSGHYYSLKEGNCGLKYCYGNRWKSGEKGACSIMTYETSGYKVANYFSNPNVKNLDQPTGIKDKADNARAFAITAPVAAKYK